MKIYTFLIKGKFFDTTFANSITEAKEKMRIQYNTEDVVRVI